MQPLTPRRAPSRLVGLLVLTLLLLAFGVWLAWSTPQPLHAPALPGPLTPPPGRAVPATPGGAVSPALRAGRSSVTGPPLAANPGMPPAVCSG